MEERSIDDIVRDLHETLQRPVSNVIKERIMARIREGLSRNDGFRVIMKFVEDMEGEDPDVTASAILAVAALLLLGPLFQFRVHLEILFKTESRHSAQSMKCGENVAISIIVGERRAYLPVKYRNISVIQPRASFPS